MRCWFNAGIFIAIIAIIAIAAAVATQCRKAANGRQTAKNGPRTDTAPDSAANRQDTGKVRIAAERLSSGDVIGKHVHGISLLRTFRNIGIERSVFMLPDQ